MFRDSRQVNKCEHSYSVETPVILENEPSSLLSFIESIYFTNVAHRQLLLVIHNCALMGHDATGKDYNKCFSSCRSSTEDLTTLELTQVQTESTITTTHLLSLTTMRSQ